MNDLAISHARLGHKSEAATLFDQAYPLEAKQPLRKRAV